MREFEPLNFKLDRDRNKKYKSSLIIAVVIAVFFGIFILTNKGQNSKSGGVRFLSQEEKLALMNKYSVIKLPEVESRANQDLFKLPKEISAFIPPLPAAVGYKPDSVKYTTADNGYHIFYTIFPSQYITIVNFDEIFAAHKEIAGQSGWQVINLQKTDNFGLLELEDGSYKVRISYLPKIANRLEVELEVLKK